MGLRLHLHENVTPLNGYLSTCLLSVYTLADVHVHVHVGDESVFRAKYPLWHMFTFACVYVCVYVVFL